EELGGVQDLALGVAQRLAVLDGDELCDAFGVANDQLIGLAQDFCALARLARRPAFEGVGRRVDGGLGVLDARARNRSDLVLGRGVDDVEALIVGGLAPFSADPEVGRDVSEKIVVHDNTYADSERRTVSVMRSTVGNTMSSITSAAGNGMC